MSVQESTKWWGWGEEGKRFELDSRPQLFPYLRKYFPLLAQPVVPVPHPDDFDIPPSRLHIEQLQALSQIMPENIFTDKMTRLRHAVGKSYHDLLRLRYRQDLHFPDAVVFPHREEEIQELFRWAEAQKVALVPFGGGTSVVGGVEAICSTAQVATVTVNLRGLDKIIAFHPESLLVEAEAGITGPRLEEYLNVRGFTLGHSPESFVYSTLGGWLAARSAGQFSTRYGKIEEMVESVRMVTPRGVWETRPIPASATGPDLKQWIVGSEGTFGIITKAALHIHPLPKQKFYRAYLFPEFTEGVDFVQNLMKAGSRPALVRLLDGAETDFALALVKWPTRPIGAQAAAWSLKWLDFHGFKSSRRSLLLLGFEGSRAEVKAEKSLAKRLLAAHKVFSLGQSPAFMWYRHRHEHPYLRDELIDRALLLDTLETASEWHRVLPLYQAVREAIHKTLVELNIPGVVLGHLSHLYQQGSSLYFIILAQPSLHKELEQWWRIKTAASDAILRHGGTISHHHGIGTDHAIWFRQEIDSVSLGALQNLKAYVDPAGVLNPGKLLPPQK